MKKGLILALFMSMFLVLAGCGNKTETLDSSLPSEWQNEEEVVVDNSEMDEEEFESTMENLYKKGGKMTCTMTTNEDGVKMQWTLYIDGKNMRSDANGNLWWNEISMSTIIKDGYSYTRSSMEKEWWKFPYEDEEDEDDEEYYDDEHEEESIVKFVCKKWVSSKKVFDLPKNVTFNEMPDFDF
jgi:hypothetical protein